MSWGKYIEKSSSKLLKTAWELRKWLFGIEDQLEYVLKV